MVDNHESSHESKQVQFISLQDICKLKLLLDVNQFPMKSLAQLPRSIRSHILRSLPIFDRLHYEDDRDFHEYFFKDLENTDSCTNKYGKEKGLLFQSLFKTTEMPLVIDCCRINLEEASLFLDCLSSENNDESFDKYVFNYIGRCCSCKVFELTRDYYSRVSGGLTVSGGGLTVSGGLTSGNSSAAQKPSHLVVPSRFIDTFLIAEKPTEVWRSSEITIGIHDPQAFIRYCKLHSESIGTKLSIDTIKLLELPLWREYTAIREKIIEEYVPKSNLPGPIASLDETRPLPLMNQSSSSQLLPLSSSATVSNPLGALPTISQPNPLGPLPTISQPIVSMVPLIQSTLSNPPTSLMAPPSTITPLQVYPPACCEQPDQSTNTLSSSLAGQSIIPSEELIPFSQPLIVHRNTDVPVVDPTSTFLQNLLSNVEHLEIGTNEYFEPSYLDEEEFSFDAPSFIMHNIQSSRLKSVLVRGICSTVTDTISTVAAFLCVDQDEGGGPASGIMSNRYDKRGKEYAIAPPSKPCFIESLAIRADSGDYDYVRQYMTQWDADCISSNLKNIIQCQKSTLKSVSVATLGFVYRELDTSNERLDSSSLGPEDIVTVNPDDYCSLLQTTLVDFVKFPQFKSLELGESPDIVCYPLVIAFLSTPASHEQSLSISLRPATQATMKQYKECDIPTDLPSELNLQFKSLSLEGNASQLTKWILSFPSLSLKSYRLSTHHLSAAVSTMPSMVNVQHFILFVEENKFSDQKLDSFISGNPSLTTLTISKYGYDHFPNLLSSINKCLKRLVIKQATLESISLERVDISRYVPKRQPAFQNSQQGMFMQQQGISTQSGLLSNTNPGYDFTQWINPSVSNTLAQCQSVISPGGGSSLAPMIGTTQLMDIQHQNNELVLFFMLLQKLNATLTLMGEHFFLSRTLRDDLTNNLIPLLEQAKVKIRKITLEGDYKGYEDVFSSVVL